MVHLTAEYWPFARTGGLGEAVSGLASFQAAVGMPTTVVLPLYRQVRETAPNLERAGPPFTVTLGDRTETAWLYRVQDGAAGGPHVFFIEHPDFFDRAGIYGDDTGDYPDNALRFARRIGWRRIAWLSSRSRGSRIAKGTISPSPRWPVSPMTCADALPGS